MARLGRDGSTGSTGGSRASGGIEGSSGKYVHPVYKNMNPKARAAADKVVANTVIVNKGKPSEIIKSLRQAREDIASMARQTGSRPPSLFGTENRRIYRGSRG